jgi:hypothetical protein
MKWNSVPAAEVGINFTPFSQEYPIIIHKFFFRKLIKHYFELKMKQHLH